MAATSTQRFRRGTVAALLGAMTSGCGPSAPSSSPPSAPVQQETTQQGLDTGEEHLGPRDGGMTVAGQHPVVTLMNAQKSSPRGELVGKHPRVLLDTTELAELQRRAKSTHKDLWKDVLTNLRAFTSEPPEPPAQDRRVQNVVGLGIAEASLAWVIERDPKYLKAAKKWIDYAISYDVWGYAYSKPNIDLAAGHLLYGLGLGYDLLYNDLSDAERKKIRDKLIRQGRFVYEHFKPQDGRTYAYSQNHVYIPTVGLATAAYALYGEVPEAEDWARLSRAIVGRSLATYSQDGYFYESFEYFVFAVPWLVMYATLHEQFTGEKLWDLPGFRNMHTYLAHVVLPGGKDVFDFGDSFSGSDTRLRKTDDVDRTHPGGHLHSNYNLLHATARWFQDGSAQAVAQEMKNRGDVSWYNYMSLLWFDPTVEAAALQEVPRHHYFPDHEVVFYRTSWEDDATALAFKSGPPEGHSTDQKRKRFPDWHLSSGHAHPDANSFIFVGRGQYLTGDSGYSGVPRTDQHNTLLIDGHGQRSVSEGHNAFLNFPYERLNEINLKVLRLEDNEVHLLGTAQSAYPKSLGLKKFERTLHYANGQLTISDDLEAAQPSIFTTLVHADESLKKSGDEHLITRNGVSLRLRVEQPEQPNLQIEPNWMTGPGRPGSVQKGDRESRGERLKIENPTPSEKTSFVVHMKLESTPPFNNQGTE